MTTNLPRHRRNVSDVVASGVTVVLAALSAGSGVFAGGTEGWAQAIWLVVLILSAGGVVAWGEYLHTLRERRRAAVESTAVVMRAAMNDAIDPIVRQLGRLALARPGDREVVAGQLVPLALNSASQLLGPGQRIRASFFDIVTGPPARLRPVMSEGRAGAAQTEFVAGTNRGDATFAMIAANTQQFCADVSVDPPPGWDPAHAGDYVSFISVPVVAATRAYGMLSVDAVATGVLTSGDVPIMRLLAGLLADGLAFEDALDLDVDLGADAGADE